MSVNVCPDDIFWITEYFVTKLDVVTWYHEPECDVEKSVCYLRGEGYNESSYDQNMTLYTISSELLILWQPNLYIIVSQSVLWKKKNTAFKVKDTAKVQNVNKCLSRWYLLKRQTFCYHTWYGDASSGLSWFFEPSQPQRITSGLASWRAGVSCKKIGLLSSWSGSQQGLIWSKYDSSYCMSSALLILLPPNLVWWYIIISVMQEVWFAIFEVKVTVNTRVFKYDSTISTELLIFLQPNLIGWFIVVSWNDLCQNWIVVFKVKVIIKIQNFIESCILYLLCHWFLATKLSVLMYCY